MDCLVRCDSCTAICSLNAFLFASPGGRVTSNRQSMLVIIQWRTSKPLHAFILVTLGIWYSILLNLHISSLINLATNRPSCLDLPTYCIRRLYRIWLKRLHLTKGKEQTLSRDKWTTESIDSSRRWSITSVDLQDSERLRASVSFVRISFETM